MKQCVVVSLALALLDFGAKVPSPLPAWPAPTTETTSAMAAQVL
jgi:hypothetical protein